MSWWCFPLVELERSLLSPYWFDSVEHLLPQKNSVQWWRWMLALSPLLLLELELQL
jgi:hypothetical protein